MAEQQENLGENVQTYLLKAEQFIEEKQKLVLGVGIGVLVLAAGIFYLAKMYLPAQNEKAQKAMYMAEFAFAKDSFNLALNGRAAAMGTVKPFQGFAEVGKEYSWTKSGKLANFYAGICCLHLKKFAEAKEFLDKCSPDDPIIGAVHLSALGDAYAETGDMDKATGYYVKAAEYSKNDAYTPMFLFKAGLAYEYQKKPADALKYYEKVKELYPNSEEGRDIEKYIARASAN